MKTLLLTLIASTIGVLSLAADQSSPALPLIPSSPGQLIESLALPTLPPGWQVIGLEPTVNPINGHRCERLFLLNPTTRQMTVWVVEIHL
jgi:hypothetical protein